MLPPSSLLILLLLGALVGVVRAEASPATEAESFEADREAILSMAGDWRVAYRFEELFALEPGSVLHPPYRIAGFERVVVLENEGGHIGLQHLLVDRKGEVTKHWRQDWDYQRSSFWEYVGEGRWRSVDLDPKEVAGSWTQTVWNVDDAPRYAGYGRWSHRRGVSEWVSHPLWRPLPRRELTRRSDYDRMHSVMHQLISREGWVIEEENDKVRRGKSGEVFLVRELGVIGYRRGSKEEFPEAARYRERTGPFWKTVRSTWEGILAKNREVGYLGKEDARKLAESLFAAADRFDPAKTTEEQLRSEILGLIGQHCFFVPKEGR